MRKRQTTFNYSEEAANRFESENSAAAVLEEEIREKSSIARSARASTSTRYFNRHSSTFMPRKKEIFGEISTINVEEPCKYYHFKELLNKGKTELCRDYLTSIMQKYDVGVRQISKMFGCDGRQVTAILNTLGIKSACSRGRKSAAKSIAWAEFLAKSPSTSSNSINNPNPVVSETVKPVKEETKTPEETPSNAITFYTKKDGDTFIFVMKRGEKTIVNATYDKSMYYAFDLAVKDALKASSDFVLEHL